MKNLLFLKKLGDYLQLDIPRCLLWSMMKFVMKTKKAICLTTGINIQQNMGSKYQLEWDHIFPWSKLKVSGYISQKIGVAPNKAITSAVAI